MKKWIVFRREDNKRIGLFDSQSKCNRAAGEVITVFEGTFQEAYAFAKSIEKVGREVSKIQT